MLHIRLLSLPFVLLAGCAGPETGFALASVPWPFAASQDQSLQGRFSTGTLTGPRQFNFDWQLSGDPEIMPVQVFDDGHSMWLQFAPEGVWPAVFEVVNHGWKPLTYRRESPYMVLGSVYPKLELRGGHLRGTVQRAGGTLTGGTLSTAPAIAAAPQSAPSSVVAPAATASPVPVSRPSRAVAVSVPGTGVSVETQTPAAMAQPSAQASLPAPVTTTAYLGTPVPRYAVSPADQTIRQALERWARKSGWTFSAEHWVVDVDIPLVGDAAFTTDFKTAVRELLAATEMGDIPLQPCFYSNQVLRVVPYAQACDRSAGSRAVS